MFPEMGAQFVIGFWSVGGAARGIAAVSARLAGAGGGDWANQQDIRRMFVLEKIEVPRQKRDDEGLFADHLAYSQAWQDKCSESIHRRGWL